VLLLQLRLGSQRRRLQRLVKLRRRRAGRGPRRLARFSVDVDRVVRRPGLRRPRNVQDALRTVAFAFVQQPQFVAVRMRQLPVLRDQTRQRQSVTKVKLVSDNIRCCIQPRTRRFRPSPWQMRGPFFIIIKKGLVFINNLRRYFKKLA